MATIDYENYKVYSYTKNKLIKKFGEKTACTYLKILGFLYQNGFDVNVDTEKELIEQFDFYNWFKDTEDFEDLKSVSSKNDSFEIGKRIIIEECKNILVDSSFAKQEAISFIIEKKFAEINFEKVKLLNERLFELFNSTDSEIYGAVNKIENIKDIKSRINQIKERADKQLKLPVWLNFKDLRTVLYSFYVRNSKEKTDVHKLSLVSNINDEIYGGLGGYNPVTREIKTMCGSNVYDIKTIKNLSESQPSLLKLKTMATTIIKDTKDSSINEESEILFKWLARWTKGYETDFEKAKRIVVNIMLNGTLELLKFKYNLSLLDDKRNSQRAEKIKIEFKDILNFCGIENGYLF